MQLELRHLNETFFIVDTSVPGGRTVEQHAEEARAKSRMRLLSRVGEVTHLKAAAPPTIATPSADAGGGDPLLLGVLTGSVKDVLGRIEAANDGEVLLELARLEGAGAARRSVLKALAARLKASA